MVPAASMLAARLCRSWLIAQPRGVANARFKAPWISQRIQQSSFLHTSVAVQASRKDIEQQLNEAVAEENYAEAARLRDELMSMGEDPTDLQQIRHNLNSAIQAEDYKEAVRLKDLYDEALVTPKDEISFTSAAITHDVLVSATSAYVPQRSHPDRNMFFFIYQISMTNKGKHMVQLKSRHWTITDANGKVSNVSGEGVVGQKPILAPGASFKYMSACPIGTSEGTMHGTYEFMMLKEDGSAASNVDVKIAPFLLSTSVIGSLGT
eukprot:jgi/Ulvmu1/7524/UM037_0068.1